MDKFQNLKSCSVSELLERHHSHLKKCEEMLHDTYVCLAEARFIVEKTASSMHQSNEIKQKTRITISEHFKRKSNINHEQYIID